MPQSDKKKTDFAIKNRKGGFSNDNNNNGDRLHPLELKYGKEPRIEPIDLWQWH